MQAGSDLNLTCTFLTTPEPPVAVIWRQVQLLQFLPGIRIRNISTSATDPNQLEMNSTENIIQRLACYQQIF